MSDHRHKTQYDIVVINRTRQRLPLAFVRSAVTNAAKELGAYRAAIGIVFFGERSMRRVAARYHQKDEAVNVLSFPYMRNRHGAVLRGDIALCPKVVKREAKKYGRPFQNHLVLLVIHGMVHVGGYTHHTATDAKIMERIEARIARRVGIRSGKP